MAPWDELAYLQAVKETSFGGIAQFTGQIADANPQRLAIIISYQSGTGQVNISTKSSVSNTVGFALAPSHPIEYNIHEFPGLVQGQWFANIVANTAIVVWEIIANSWPPERNNG